MKLFSFSHYVLCDVKNIYPQIKNVHIGKVRRETSKQTVKRWWRTRGRSSGWFSFGQCVLSGKAGNTGRSVM